MKTLYLIRGLPGSGKTTLAHQLAQAHPNSICLSADDYFTDVKTGKYYFDPNKIKEAHQYCQDGVESFMESNLDTIIVHNHFSRQWELEAYRRLAEQFNYNIFEIICNNRFKNIHNVPDHTIKNMANRFEY